MICGVVTEGAGKELPLAWQRFRLSTPVGKYQFALAKYITYVVAFGMALICSYLYMQAVFGIRKENLTAKELSVATGILLICLLLSVVVQVLMVLFRSMEKAMYTILAIGFVLGVISVKEMAESDTMHLVKKIEEMCESVFVFSPLIMILIILLGFAATVFLYKRRES